MISSIFSIIQQNPYIFQSSTYSVSLFHSHRPLHNWPCSYPSQTLWYKQWKVRRGCLEKFALGRSRGSRGKVWLPKGPEDFSLFVRLWASKTKEDATQKCPMGLSGETVGSDLLKSYSVKSRLRWLENKVCVFFTTSVYPCFILIHQLLGITRSCVLFLAECLAISPPVRPIVLPSMAR